MELLVILFYKTCENTLLKIKIKNFIKCLMSEISSFYYIKYSLVNLEIMVIMYLKVLSKRFLTFKVYEPVFKIQGRGISKYLNWLQIYKHL